MFGNIRRKTQIIVVGLLAAAVATLVGDVTAETASKGDPYPLGTCIITGMKLGSMGEPIILTHEGREIRFCCNGCVAKFKADPAQYIKKIDEKIVKQQTPYYPLDTCLISGEKLGGEMGEPVNVVYRNRLVRFCCAGCEKIFAKEPEKHLARLDEAAIAKQKPDYPLDTCVVSGGKLGGAMGEPVDYVSGNRLVRFCCKGCINAFSKDPAAYTRKIDDALKTDEQEKQDEHQHQQSNEE